MNAANIQLGRTAITLIMTTTATTTVTTTTTTAITITTTTAITITTTTTTTTTTRITMAATTTTKMVQRHCQLEFFALRNQKKSQFHTCDFFAPDNPGQIRDHKENKQTYSHIGRHHKTLVRDVLQELLASGIC